MPQAVTSFIQARERVQAAMEAREALMARLASLQGALATVEQQAPGPPKLLPAHQAQTPIPEIPIQAGPMAPAFQVGQATMTGQDLGDRTEPLPELIGRVGTTMKGSPYGGYAKAGEALEFLMSPPKEGGGADSKTYWGNAAKAVAQLIPGFVELPRKLLSPSKQDKVDAIHEIGQMLPHAGPDLRESLGSLLGSMTDAVTVMFGDEGAGKRLAASGGIEPAVSATMVVAPFTGKAKAESARRAATVAEGRLAESATIPEMRREAGMENLSKTDAEIQRQAAYDADVAKREALGEQIQGERQATEEARLAQIEQEKSAAEAKQQAGMRNLRETEEGIKAEAAEQKRESDWDQYVRDRESLAPEVAYQQYVNRLLGEPALEGPVEGEGFLMRKRASRQAGEGGPTDLGTVLETQKEPTRKEFRPETGPPPAAPTPKQADPREVLGDRQSYSKREIEDAIIAGEEMIKTGRDQSRVPLGPAGMSSLRGMIDEARAGVLKKPAAPPAPEASQIRTTNQKVRWNIAPKSIAWEVLNRIERASQEEGPGMIFEGKNVTRYGSSKPKWVQRAGMPYAQLRQVIAKVRRGEEITEAQYNKLRKVYDDAKYEDFQQGQTTTLSEERAARKALAAGPEPETGDTSFDFGPVRPEIEISGEGFGAKNTLFTKERLDQATGGEATLTSGFDPAAALTVAGYYLEGGIREYPRVAERMRERFPGISNAEIAKAFKDARRIVGERGIPPVVAGQQGEPGAIPEATRKQPGIPAPEGASTAVPEISKPVPASDIPKAGTVPVEKPQITPTVNETKPSGAKPGPIPEAPTTVPVKEAEFAKEGVRPETPRQEQERVAAEVQKVLEDAGLPKDESNVIGLNKAEQDRIRQMLDKPELRPEDTRRWETVLTNAKNSGADKTALELAAEIKKAKRPLTDREHAGMVLKAAQLMDAYKKSMDRAEAWIDEGRTESAKVERRRAETIIEQLDLLTEATREGRRETARAMSIGRMFINRQDYSLAGVTQRYKAAKGKALTEAEHAEVRELVTKHDKLQEKYIELDKQYTDLVAEQERLRAERILRSETEKARVETRTSERKQSITKDQTAIEKQLRDLGFRLNDVTGVSAEGLYLIGRYAINLMREGELTLEGVARRVREKMPDLTDLDVYEAINTRDPKVQRKAKNETVKRIAVMKKQASLMVEIANAEKGLFETKARTRADVDPVVSDLKTKLHTLRKQAYQTVLDQEKLGRVLQKINEAQDRLDNYRLLVKEKKPVTPETPEIKAARTTLRDLERELRTKDALAKAEEQLRTGEFEIRAPETKAPLPPSYERAMIELKRARRQINERIAAREPMTASRIGSEAMNTLRTLKATADVSATLRQGLVQTARLGLTRPTRLAKVVTKSLQATFDRYTAEQVMHAIERDPDFVTSQRAGLEYTDLEGRGWRKEEMFASQFLDRVWGFRQVTRASSQHMTTYLNLLRQESFKDFLRKYPNATDAELATWANWINVTTGRGKLSPGAAKALSYVFFAPRFSASRFQTPYYAITAMKESPRIRLEVAKDIVSTVSVGLTAMALAKIAGADVSYDPRSSDFGKIRIDNTRIDIFGGFQQPARLVLRLGLGVTDRAGITGKDVSDAEKNSFDALSALGRFMSYKLAPHWTLGAELVTGKTIVGQKATPIQTLEHAVFPLVVDDIIGTWEIEGPGRAAVTSPLTLLGVGVSTYEDSETVTRANVHKLMREGKQDEATRIVNEWNEKHPDPADRILYITIKGERVRVAPW